MDTPLDRGKESKNENAKKGNSGILDALITTFAIDWNRYLNRHMRTFIKL